MIGFIRRVRVGWVVCLGWVSLVAWSAPASPADAKLTSFFRAYLDAAFALRPMDATRLGDRRFDGQLDDLSPSAQAAWVRHLRSALAALPREVPYRELGREAQIDYEILRDELTTQLWVATEANPFENDPRAYNEYINDSVYLLFSQSTLPPATNAAHAVARMRRIPEVVNAARANLRRPPRAHTETAIRQNRGAIAFYESDLFTVAGSMGSDPSLRAAATAVVASLRGYQEFLEKDLLPRAEGDWRLGRRAFARKLELVLNAGISADEVLREAEAEFSRVERELAVIARQAWGHYFPGVPVPVDDGEGRRELTAKVLGAIARQHGTAASLTDDVRRNVAEIKSFIEARRILTLPSPDRCRIIEMPEFQRGNSTAYMNAPPPLDPQADGYYAVSPPPRDWDAARVASYLEEYNHHLLQILTIHEAYPGHYVQLEYGNQNPSLIRKVFGSGVYIEGWAVYTEQMMLDQGYGDGDPALRLSQLKFYLRAVANAILDHRMHCRGMTDEEAMDLLVRRSFQSEGEARLKVVRAKQSSTQLSTYFVGRMAHYRLRQAVQRELGARFDLAAYHEAVLRPGAVPVKYLPEIVRRELEHAPEGAVAADVSPR
ncbi:MAG: DUF885 domain-containing protein [Verrucomicrobiales bacterium]|nr:DUF885 domain-containing protein [Verrucomicrobiales bacterium]